MSAAMSRRLVPPAAACLAACSGTPFYARRLEQIADCSDLVIVPTWRHRELAGSGFGAREVGTFRLLGWCCRAPHAVNQRARVQAKHGCVQRLDLLQMGSLLPTQRAASHRSSDTAPAALLACRL